jgi:hypothetical protein
MRVRGRFQLALLLTVLFAAGYEAIPRTIAAFHAVEHRHELALADAAIAHVHVPTGFRRVHSTCSFYPCYFSREPASKAAHALPVTLASIHAHWETSRARCTILHAQPQCVITGTLDAQPISIFLTPSSPGTKLEIAGP